MKALFRIFESKKTAAERIAFEQETRRMAEVTRDRLGRFPHASRLLLHKVHAHMATVFDDIEPRVEDGSDVYECGVDNPSVEILWPNISDEKLIRFEEVLKDPDRANFCLRCSSIEVAEVRFWRSVTTRHIDNWHHWERTFTELEEQGFYVDLA